MMDRICRFFSFLIGITFLFSCTGSSDSFLISGQIKNAKHVHALLLFEGERKLDSVFLNEEGRFKMERSASQHRLFTLQAGTERFPLILINGDEVKLNADLSDSTGNYSVEGSKMSEALVPFKKLELERIREENKLNEEFALLTQSLDENAKSLIQEEFVQTYGNFMRSYSQKVHEFAKNQDPLVGFYPIYSLDPLYAENIWIQYAQLLEGKYEDNVVVRAFLDEVDKLKKIAVGEIAPDFESYTENNRVVKVTDFRGKYTLIDFWASWCVPCREENPNLVRLYNQYKDKDFTIYGVSLDTNPGSWLKAVKDDNLPWTQVSDLKAWKSEFVELYRLKSIPASVLLDQDGRILAKDLRGRQLEQFLNELLD